MEEPATGTETIAPTIPPEEDSEAKIAKLEAEKTKLTEEKENYRKAYLKANEGGSGNEDEDARIRRLVNEGIADSRLADIAREQDGLLRQALKENKELKLAQLNKTGPSASVGAHNESVSVRDTLVTPEQLAQFKAWGWDDKKIEAYKKNLLKNR